MQIYKMFYIIYTKYKQYNKIEMPRIQDLTLFYNLFFLLDNINGSEICSFEDVLIHLVLFNGCTVFHNTEGPAFIYPAD